MIRQLAIAALVSAAPAALSQQLQILSVVNAASFQPGLPAGGSLATVFVTGLTGTPGLYTPQPSPPLPFQLAGVEVTVNGAFAPILAVLIPPAGSSMLGQINFQVPQERNASAPSSQGFTVGQAVGGVATAGIPSNPDPGGFFSDANGYAVAQHAADYSPVTVQNPAHPGEMIIAYADDFFQVWPPAPIGVPVPQQPLYQTNSNLGASLVVFGYDYMFLQSYPQGIEPYSSFANTPALQIQFEGLAPGLVGVEQINFVVPANQAPGNWALFFNGGSCADGSGSCSLFGDSSPYVTLPVQ